jgi:hypothetical protein
MSRKKQQRLRPELVAQFGGKCQECGYNRCLAALHFHHEDSSEKDLWSPNRGNASVEEIKAHPERFRLLCSNCHIEEHERIRSETCMTIICQQCQKPFRGVPYRVKAGKDRFCGKQCVNKHYQTLRSKSIELSLLNGNIENILKSVRKTEGCWFWDGFMVNSKPTFNHRKPDGSYTHKPVIRVLWENYVGPIENKTRLYRYCDTINCVRPDHHVAGVRPFARRNSGKIPPRKSRKRQTDESTRSLFEDI